MTLGFCEGETCNRNGCQGEIQLHPHEGCTCHINPPCSACTSPRHFCPVCGWEEKDDPDLVMVESTFYFLPAGIHIEYKPHILDRTKIDYHTQMDTHFTQKVIGVFPVGTSQEQVLEKVRGTFGGRFEKWSPSTGDFVYIAYTD